MCCVYLLKIFNKSLDRVKVEPILSRLVVELLFAPDFPAETDSHAFVNTENFVMFDVVPLPCDKLAAVVCVPSALSANAGVVANVGIANVGNLIGIGIDFDATDTHIEAIR